MNRMSVCVLSLIAGAMITYALQNVYSKYHLNNEIQLVKDSFNIFGEGNTEELVAKYHDKNYIQYSDGKVLNYQNLLDHVKHLKSILKSPVEIHYDHVIAEGDKVVTVHRAKATKKDGKSVEIKVIALHQIKDGKIILTDELTHVITGNEEDKEMGSRH
jgi:ketosteroid isomerase-like protein